MVFVEKLNLILIKLQGSHLQQLWLIVLLWIWHSSPGIVVIFCSTCRRASPSSKVAFYQYAFYLVACRIQQFPIGFLIISVN